jgi:multidrug efflux system outer membrane protein
MSNLVGWASAYRSIPRGLKPTLLLVAALVSACAAPGGASHQTPSLELPSGSAQPAVAADWWKSFNDEPLNALVDEALRNNRDLARAMARIDESRAALRSARADRFPTVSAGASATRQRVSENGTTPLFGASPIFNDYRASLKVGYEVDLWSRAANLTAAARSELLAGEYARDTLRTALAAQVVQSYATLQSLDAQYKLYGESVQAQRDSLKLQRLRFDSGDISELDIRQLDAELITNESQLPKIDRARGEAERALALVLGRSPRALIEQGVARGAAPVVAGSGLQGAVAGSGYAVPEGLPSDLLQRRPDVLAAEARLRAAGARVDAARAAYFPSISLTAELGRESTALSQLTDAPSLIWGVVASLTQPIWNAGRIAASNDAAKARELQAELDYRDSVAGAFKEARDALGAYSETRVSLQSAAQRAQALERAAELTRLRYNGGEASRLDVINAERLSLNARAQSADAQRALAAAQADVYRAFGGGWAAPEQRAQIK